MFGWLNSAATKYLWACCTVGDNSSYLWNMQVIILMNNQPLARWRAMLSWGHYGTMISVMLPGFKCIYLIQICEDRFSG